MLPCLPIFRSARRKDVTVAKELAGTEIQSRLESVHSE
jgi:hypothetical protein